MQETQNYTLKTEYLLNTDQGLQPLPDPKEQKCSDLWDTVLDIYYFPAKYEDVQVRQRSSLIEAPEEKGTLSYQSRFSPIENPYVSELEERCGEKVIFPFNS